MTLGIVCVSFFKFHLKKLQKDDINRNHGQELLDLIYLNTQVPKRLAQCVIWHFVIHGNYIFNHYRCTYAAELHHIYITIPVRYIMLSRYASILFNSFVCSCMLHIKRWNCRVTHQPNLLSMLHAYSQTNNCFCCHLRYQYNFTY